MYRPPSGAIEEFLSEWESILVDLPKTNVNLMGDFNIDLRKPNHKFKTTFYSQNFIPTISQATHEKPGCTASLIDNIFVNSTGNLLNSGIFENKVTHHSPVFSFMNYSLPSTAEQANKCPRYDYCESNIEFFCKNLVANVI